MHRSRYRQQNNFSVDNDFKAKQEEILQLREALITLVHRV